MPRNRSELELGYPWAISLNKNVKAHKMLTNHGTGLRVAICGSGGHLYDPTLIRPATKHDELCKRCQNTALEVVSE